MFQKKSLNLKDAGASQVMTSCQCVKCWLCIMCQESLFEFQFCKIQQTPQYYTLSFVKTRKTDLRLRAHIFYDDSASKSSYLSLFEIYIIYPRELVLMRTYFRENILKLYFISFSRELIFAKKPTSHNSCELNFARKVPVAVTFRIRSKNGF